MAVIHAHGFISDQPRRKITGPGIEDQKVSGNEQQELNQMMPKQ
jgi:hypothetical protein